MKLMKFAFLMAVMCLTAFAGPKVYFNKHQFQLSHKAETDYNGKPSLTFPLVYSGSVQFTGWNINSQKAVCVDDEKFTPALYMTICQPCIDCFTCVPIQSEAMATPQEIVEPAVEPNKITAWNLYVVVNYKEGKVKKTYIRKVSLIDVGVGFFTGAAGQGIGAVQYVGEKAQLLLSGKKSDYKFDY